MTVLFGCRSVEVSGKVSSKSFQKIGSSHVSRSGMGFVCTSLLIYKELFQLQKTLFCNKHGLNWKQEVAQWFGDPGSTYDSRLLRSCDYIYYNIEILLRQYGACIISLSACLHFSSSLQVRATCTLAARFGITFLHFRIWATGINGRFFVVGRFKFLSQFGVYF